MSIFGCTEAPTMLAAPPFAALEKAKNSFPFCPACSALAQEQQWFGSMSPIIKQRVLLASSAMQHCFVCHTFSESVDLSLLSLC